MTEYYILDGKEPVEMPDATTWAAQFERADRLVAPRGYMVTGAVAVETKER